MHRKALRNLWRRFLSEDSGLEVLEWALVAVVFAFAASAALVTLQMTISQRFGDINNLLMP